MPTHRQHLRDLLVAAAMVGVALVATAPAGAADWSLTELNLQYGKLDTPFVGLIEPGLTEEKNTFILTLQHASEWKYGSNFFFFDVLFADEGLTGFNNNDIYGEWYPYWSVRKIGGKEQGKGILKDVRFITGLNYAAQPKVLKYLPGVGLHWNVPGFIFFNTDITAYIDASQGVADGGVPKEDDSFMFDWNWARPFAKGKFSIVGHIEYIGSRTNEFGGDVSWWVLGQPQFRFFVAKNLAIGLEWQFWINKLGDPDTDENALQALLVWQF